MSKEREMIEKLCSFQMTYSDWLLLIADAEELLAQPEQEPVAWITEWDHHDQLSKGVWSAQTLRALSFTKESAPHVIRPAYIPLYKAPPKREPLSYEHLEALVDTHHGYPMTLGRAIEEAHGIGGRE